MFNRQKLKVVEVARVGYGAEILFSDGVRASFEGFAQGWIDDLEGLRRYKLFRGHRLIFHLNSRLHIYGPMPDEHKIVLIDASLTQQEAAKYWELTRDHLDRKFFQRWQRFRDPRLRFPWRVTHEGSLDLAELKLGIVKMLESEE